MESASLPGSTPELGLVALLGKGDCMCKAQGWPRTWQMQRQISVGQKQEMRKDSSDMQRGLGTLPGLLAEPAEWL